MGGLGREKILGLVGAGMLAVGVFMPWTTGGGLSFNGLEDQLAWFLTGVTASSKASDTFFAHGWIFLALAALAVLVILRLTGSRFPGLVGIVGGVALALVVADFVAFRNLYSDMGEFSVGFGLYFSGLGAGMVSVSAFAPLGPGSADMASADTTGGTVEESPRAQPTRVVSPPPPQQDGPGPPQGPPRAPSPPGSAGRWWKDPSDG